MSEQSKNGRRLRGKSRATSEAPDGVGSAARRRGSLSVGGLSVSGLSVSGLSVFALALLGAAGTASAQQAPTVIGNATPQVFVNTQLLNSLGPGGFGSYGAAPYGYAQPYQQPAYAAPYAGYGVPQPGAMPAQPAGQPYYVTRPGTLLFPPNSFPRSQVTGGAPALAVLPPQQQMAQAPGQAPASQALIPSLPPSPALSNPVDLPRPPQIAARAEPGPAEPPSPPPSIAASEAPPPPAPEAPALGAPAVQAPAPPPPAAPEESAASLPMIPPPSLDGDSDQPLAPPPPQLAEAPAEPAMPETQMAVATDQPVAPPPPALEPEQPSQAASEPEPEEPPAPPPPALPEESESAAVAPPEPPAEPPSEPAPTVTASIAEPPPAPEPQPAPELPAAEPPTAEAPPAEPPAAEPPPAPSETQTAALPPATLDEGALRLAFGAGSADLDDGDKATLSQLAQELNADGNARVQLLAYASSSDNSASRARRLSLSRALAVRAFLIDQGVRSTRMDVRALGDKSEGGPPDRVDILPARR